MIDLSNREFGNWTVIRFDKKVGTCAYWICMCKCGRVKSVFQGNLGKRSSMCPKCASKLKITHGMSRTRLYRYFTSLKDRAKISNQPFDWDNLETFINEVGEPSGKKKYLVRVSLNKGWTKDNVEWKASFAKPDSLATAAAKLGISRQALHSRLRSGWSLEDAITTPKVNVTS